MQFAVQDKSNQALDIMMYPYPFKMQAEQEGESPVAPVEAYLGPVLPFPELPTAIPSSEPGSQYKPKKQSPSSQKKHVRARSRPFNKKQTSDPIPFPEAHVQRTPSELQLDLNERQAQYDIVQMNARIAMGKRSRAQDHPSPFLTRNHVQKPDKEKGARAEEQQQQLAPRRRGSGGWEMGYVSIEDSSLNSRSSVKRTADSKLEGGDNDDDDIFRFDL